MPFGRYLGEIVELDTRRWDWDVSLKAPVPPRFSQRKSWTFVGALADDVAVGLAIVDAGYLGNAFVYAFDRRKKALVEEKALKPFAFPNMFAPTPQAAWALSAGKRRWTLGPAVGGGWQARFSGQRLEVDLRLHGEGEGVSTLAPAGVRPFNFTYKRMAMPATLDVRVDGKLLAGQDALGIYDFTLGYPPRQTFWNWAALVGRTGDGRRFAANLVASFNNGLENCFWLEGRAAPLGQAVFHYDRAATLGPWRIFTEDGALDVTFRPEGKRAERIEAGVVASDFQQPFGRFEGTLGTASGEVAVAGSGLVEEHFAVW